MIITELYKRILTSVILLPVIVFLISADKSYFNFLLLGVLLVSSYEWFKLNKKKFSLVNFLGILVIFFSLVSAYFLRGNNSENILFILWIIFICFFSDVGGYLIGTIIGGIKLTKISPNKTLSGSIGSFVFSIFPILIISFLLKKINLEIDFYNISSKSIFLSLFFSLVCQIGDLIISYFKRLNKVKDTGKILPGHGGLLDRIDGLIFVLLFAGILKLLKFI